MSNPTDQKVSKDEFLKTLTKAVAYDGDPWGKIIFRFLLALIPTVTAVSIIVIILTYDVGKSVTADTNSAAVTLGIFDPRLGDARRFLMGLLVFMIAGLIEVSLFLVYAAFYINDPRNIGQNLGLPQGTVRVFILIIVVDALIIFAMLPGSLGDNKGVITIFGVLSTIVGFYYGSSKDKGSQDSLTDMVTTLNTPTTPPPTTPAAKSGITPVVQQPKPIDPVVRPITPVSTVTTTTAPAATITPTVTNNVTPPAATLAKEIKPLTQDPDTTGHKIIPPLDNSAH
jgi:hypothetical protein